MTQVQKLSPNDSNRIADCYELHASSQPFPWSFSTFSDMLSEPYSLSIAFNENTPVLGYVLTLQVLEETTIMDIAVDAGKRRQGIGTALINHVVSNAAKTHEGRVLLEVRATNQHAIQLYKTCGFEQVALRKNYYPTVASSSKTEQSDKEDALIMQYPLIPSVK
jgi:ribosomal-protein-alanine N-acetyltransferase